MPKLLFSKAAHADLIAIGRYTEENWGIKQRDLYVGILFSAFEKLQKSPTTGKPRDELFKEMRSIRAGKHVVYYFVRKKGLLIVGILHERMEPALHLI